VQVRRGKRRPTITLTAELLDLLAQRRERELLGAQRKINGKCEVCGAPLRTSPLGQPKRFCGDTCKHRAARARRREARLAEEASRAAERVTSEPPATGAGDDEAGPGNVPDSRPAPLPAWMGEVLEKAEPVEVLGPPTAADKRRWSDNRIKREPVAAKLAPLYRWMLRPGRWNAYAVRVCAHQGALVRIP
jgi:hypothetical protein